MLPGVCFALNHLAGRVGYFFAVMAKQPKIVVIIPGIIFVPWCLNRWSTGKRLTNRLPKPSLVTRTAAVYFVISGVTSSR